MIVPLDKLTVPQKLELLEAIWEDLRSHSADVPSPQWHRQVLEHRRVRIDRGESTMLDWEQVKRHIRDATA